MNSVLWQLKGSTRGFVAAALTVLLSLSLPLKGLATGQESKPGSAASELQRDQKKDSELPSENRQRAQPEAAVAQLAGNGFTGEKLDGKDTESGVVHQAPGQQKETAQNPITQPLAVSPEVTRQRVGVDPNQSQLLTLQDAISLALQRNLDIEAFRQGVQIAQYNLFAARGVYDVGSTADIGYRNATSAVANRFAGGGANSSFTSRTLTYNFTSSQPVERTAGFWEIDFNNSRTNTTNTAATLTTQYSTILTLSYTQPLARNLSLDANRRTIQLARRQLDLSDSAFRQRVIEIISSVQAAYWDLVFAIRNEQIAREAVELARVQLENNRKMVEAGTLAPIELRSTEAALESRKGDVIVALQGITTAENNLKGLLINDPNDKLWSASVQPTDEPQLGQSTFSLEEATKLALKNRPELEQTKLQAEQKQIDIKFYRSQVKPQIDFVGFYTNNGLAGTPAPPSPLDPLGLSSVPERFQGGYGQALRNLFSQDFRTLQGGIRLSFPWRNRIAEGNLGRALAESRQIDARQRQLVQSIQIDVRNALQAVEAARQRYEAQKANRIASEAQLRGEQERFRAGLTQNFFVLQRQTDLAFAKGNELRAKTDYNKALAELQRVTGLTLISNNVEVPPTSNSTSNNKK